MQFKFKHSKITFNIREKAEKGINLMLTFAEKAGDTYYDLSNRDPKTLIDDLSTAGSISLHDSTLILSVGAENKFDKTVLSTAALSAARYITSRNINEVNLVLSEVFANKLGITVDVLIEKFLQDFVGSLYYFDDFKTEKTQLKLAKINIISSAKLEQVIANVISFCEGYFLVRDLANNPGNIATPTYLGDVAESFAALNKQVKATVLNKEAIEKLGMDAFLGVARGSREEPKFIQLEYKGGKKNVKPFVLVGKGITFDSGGISLKPGANMDDMKYDMCGAATVLGVFLAVIRLQLPINLVVLVPTCENMPSGKAQKPGDIVKSMSGKTIEILNTDAEGRLILCDALHYAKKFEPQWVIDVATLTGACVIALGSVASGLYVNDEELYQEIYKASVNGNEKVWRMPLFEEYSALLKGNHADLLNIGGWGGKAGSVTAACFLKEFTDYKWAHLDIAGVANTAEAKGATGRPFKLLIELLRQQAGN